MLLGRGRGCGAEAVLRAVRVGVLVGQALVTLVGQAGLAEEVPWGARARAGGFRRGKVRGGARARRRMQVWRRE